MLRSRFYRKTCLFSCFRPPSSPVSPTRRSTSCKGRYSTASKRPSFRESFKRPRGTGNEQQTSMTSGLPSSSSISPGTSGGHQDRGRRRTSIVQSIINEDKPNLENRIGPSFSEMPEKWAEVTDIQPE